ncbi:tRNA (adenosine(37)-N6)-threonylcarbamoyltransferase complex transferase subunit TsaD [Natranaerobius thermophilus]|uniref:tRNA N6-adenosine threonylcarbamoyltransferase n=1 Tax=Natranaerobius thermophilus (strain ATCC BAA-1301 / DSM 18059 / JW/NM-WN-LF) TaxID=457570 RepID=B2A5Q0_NATTJ|nr:tRNA (adenosine(37)-N6)-threonylcarbamoyltransferase complex transferase subunit TsaD [Natranaerobius thermophilus]ACB83998.1 O-sialoglycoprotein endopeptidase [Natranaerobius thermophilus JW/NM-WN-LF]
METQRETVYILGIETSCDETAVSVVSNGQKVLSNVVSSQTDVHSLYGGVVPEIASREHSKLLPPLVSKAVDEAGLNMNDINAIAVTQGPGLVGPLLVGVSFAKSLAYSLKIPLIPVNHIKAHLYANFILADDDKDSNLPSFPLIALIVSGGHTNLYYLYDHDNWKLLGRSRDDASGESFDKIARALDLGYPGGPAVEKEAQKGQPNVDFPKPKLENEYDFSFSGLKSAVLNYLNRKKMKGEQYSSSDICASFQQVVVDSLVEKTISAARDNQVDTIVLAGGVSANGQLRANFKETTAGEGINLFLPRLEYCTDNAAMIAALGYHNYRRGWIASLDLNAVPNLSP